MKKILFMVALCASFVASAQNISGSCYRGFVGLSLSSWGFNI